MTASKVLFDTWAWWEVLRGSEVGAALQRRYLEAPGVEVLTAAISLGELSAKLSGEGSGESISPAVSSIRRASAVLALSAELAVEAGISGHNYQSVQRLQVSRMESYSPRRDRMAHGSSPRLSVLGGTRCLVPVSPPPRSGMVAGRPAGDVG